MRYKYKSYFDGVYKSSLLYQFVNLLTTHGNKSLFERFFYSSLTALSLSLRDNPYMIFFEVIERTRPTVFIKLKKKITKNRSKVFILPKVLSSYQQYSQSLKWLKMSCLIRDTKDKISYRLYKESISLFLNNDSFLLLKKREVYKCATLNRLNTHYRW
jgi:small subunit ribosomal protein S7